MSSSTARRNGTAAKSFVCPRQYASSCLRRADGEAKPAAIASIAGREDWQARCLREKRARNRRAKGSDSEVRVLRRERMAGSSVGGGGVTDGTILVKGSDQRLLLQVVMPPRSDSSDSLCFCELV